MSFGPFALAAFFFLPYARRLFTVFCICCQLLVKRTYGRPNRIPCDNLARLAEVHGKGLSIVVLSLIGIFQGISICHGVRDRVYDKSLRLYRTVCLHIGLAAVSTAGLHDVSSPPV